ncbi:Sec-independent protein translocase subunit TatA/TatB [Deinococcus yavapaiensis]|uniref:Sec-independent protein translocase protein TatA n=1 Tax=Deinococcus yavapaiensis KR-236 TaxID=694435 RepID=A0A318SHI1_9DEIO|nr:twin-arginine translocase TatA/TatE family subunit [Deinococcus yavapaiensis]PYE53388.1 sec-independent protein translocase protein TatA [Deinococcus yavapaiensis KR-236]
MFGLGPMEIIVILVVALVIFGPKKLPELGKSLGQGIREFRRGTSGLKEELESSFKDEPVHEPVRTQPIERTVIAPTPELAGNEDKRPQA